MVLLHMFSYWWIKTVILQKTNPHAVMTRNNLLLSALLVDVACKVFPYKKMGLLINVLQSPLTSWIVNDQSVKLFVFNAFCKTCLCCCLCFLLIPCHFCWLRSVVVSAQILRWVSSNVPLCQLNRAVESAQIQAAIMVFVCMSGCSKKSPLNECEGA